MVDAEVVTGEGLLALVDFCDSAPGFGVRHDIRTSKALSNFRRMDSSGCSIVSPAAVGSGGTGGEFAERPLSGSERGMAPRVSLPAGIVSENVSSILRAAGMPTLHSATCRMWCGG